MIFGKDFFKWMAFAIELIKLLIRIFGDDEDRKTAEQNGFDTKKVDSKVIG